LALTAATAENRNSAGALRIPLGDLMKFEILINEQAKIWVFHDKVLPGRLAWVEYDPVSGIIELIPHDMRAGIVYAEVPPALQARVRSANLVYFYLTDGEKVTGFQKAPIQVRRAPPA
jgi:hypothetical protein